MIQDQPYIAITELSSGTIYKRADGILIFRQGKGRDSVTLNELKEQLAAFLEIQKGEKSPLMVVVDQLKKLENEEKMFLMSTVDQFATKICMVTNTPIPTFIFNVLFFLFRPPIPAKIFKTEQDGLMWLKEDHNPI